MDPGFGNKSKFCFHIFYNVNNSIDPGTRGVDPDFGKLKKIIK